MKVLKQIILPILVTGIWINISETVRWIFLIEPFWIEKYQGLGIPFPNETVNTMVWMVWGFFFATTIFLLSKKYSLVQTAVFSWVAAFVMMWMVVWNGVVLPTRILWINIPLSLLEAFVGAYICIKLFKVNKT